MTLSPSEIKLKACKQTITLTRREFRRSKGGEEDKPAKRSANDIAAGVNGTGSCILTLLK